MPKKLLAVLLSLPPLHWALAHFGFLRPEPGGTLMVSGAVAVAVFLAYLGYRERQLRLCHPELGEMETVPDSTNFWSQRRQWSLGQRRDLVHGQATVVFLEGSTDGPSPGALEGLAAFGREHREARSHFEAELLPWAEDYGRRSVMQPVPMTASGLWGTEELVSVTLRGLEDWSAAFRFSWQDPDDGELAWVDAPNAGREA